MSEYTTNTHPPTHAHTHTHTHTHTLNLQLRIIPISCQQLRERNFRQFLLITGKQQFPIAINNNNNLKLTIKVGLVSKKRIFKEQHNCRAL